MSSLVYVKNPSGRIYVYENTTYWDNGDHYGKKSIKVGHIDYFPKPNVIF